MVKISAGRRGLCITSKKGSFLFGLGAGRLIVVVRIWRTHVWTNPLMEKVSKYMQDIFPGTGRLEARGPDMRCLALCLPRSVGTFWWFAVQSSSGELERRAKETDLLSRL